MKYSVKRYLFLSILCMILFSLTGCWDNRDITKLNIVSAVGIDKTSDNQIEVTIQIIKISTVKAKAQGSSDETFWTYSKKGTTVFETLRNILTTIDRRPFFSFNELIVIGEDLAKDGVMNVLDYFERDHESRRRSYILIAKGISAKEVLNAKTDIASVPALHLVDIIKTSSASTRIIEIELFDLLKSFSSPGKNTVAGVIEKLNSEDDELKIKNLSIEGGAVFIKDKLQGWIETKDLVGYLIITNEFKNGIINTPNPYDEKKLVAIEVKKVNSKMDVKFNDGKPIIILEVKATGNIGEQQGPGDLTTKEMVKKLDKELEKKIEEQITKVFKLAQEYKNDFFGFGDIIHRKNLRYWKKVKDNWDNEFSDIPVEIKIKAKVTQPGQVKKALEPK